MTKCVKAATTHIIEKTASMIDNLYQNTFMCRIEKDEEVNTHSTKSYNKILQIGGILSISRTYRANQDVVSFLHFSFAILPLDTNVGIK